MKITTKETVVTLETYSPITGEVIPVEGRKVKSDKYYSIQKITTRINAMTFLEVLTKTCKSSKDIEIVNFILDKQKSDGNIYIPNITKEAENMDISRSKLNKILKELLNNNLLYKKEKGIYLVNPFIFIGKKVRSNEAREKLQQEWTGLDIENK